MGCVGSSNANKQYETRAAQIARINRSLETGGNNIVRKPCPWAYGDRPISSSELQEMRNVFWENALRTTGRPEIWEALRAAAEGDLRNAQKIINDHKIRLGKPDMSVCYDDNDTRYNLPLFVLSEPTNMDYRVLRVK